MGLMRACVRPDVICKALVEGRPTVKVIQGVPANARILDIFTDYTQMEPMVNIIFESDDWVTTEKALLDQMPLTDIVLAEEWIGHA